MDTAVQEMYATKPLPPKSIRRAFGDMRVEDLLDLQFFEKCFFGKKLSAKDQVIFRIYARELLDIIKKSINRQI